MIDIAEITETPLYKELKLELEICKIGGLFLALYEAEQIVDIIIKHLEQDLPQQFVFSLHMTPQKVGFPTFFEQSFEHTGKKSNIFHLVRIEKLSEQLQSNFIDYLQYTRERFKSNPYSIVFWITPLFRRQIFLSAPDFYHWISGIYDFSNVQVNPESLTDLKLPNDTKSLDWVSGSYDHLELKMIPSVPFEGITKYLEEVVWQYEHWDEVKSKGDDFIIEAIGRANLSEYYVPTYCIDKDEKEILLDDIFKEFLLDNARNFLTLLGDFGTGKTSFSVHYFIRLAKSYLINYENRIPLFISLKNYPGKLNIEEFIVKEFYENFNITLSFEIFLKLALQGRFVFFIDGFDEMASLSNQKMTEENFRELTKLSFENILFMKNSCERIQKANKVFLTCRTHYFFDEVQEKAILKSNHTVLYRDYATKTNYEIAKIKLKEFNDKQIKEYVFKNVKNEDTTRDILTTIENTYNLHELSTRPLLLEMIIKTLPVLKDKKKINAANLYKAYTQRWIQWDFWRSQMKPEGKRNFMWEMAFKMYSKGGDFSLHYTKLDKPKSEYFKQDLGDTDDYYKYETTTCTFLNRDANGNYTFIHKSFMEYFLAEYYWDSIINRQERLYLSSELNKETKFFLKLIISEERNLANLDLYNLELSDIDLRNSNLTGANLEYSDFSKTNLAEANLLGANLRFANFSMAILTDALLGKNDFTRAHFRGAKLERVSFAGQNLSELNLSEADLSGAILTDCNLRGSRMNRANLRNANLCYADLSNAILSNANISGANFSYTTLVDIDWDGVSQSPTKLYAIYDKKMADFEQRIIHKLYLKIKQIANNTVEEKIKTGEFCLNPIFNNNYDQFVQQILAQWGISLKRWQRNLNVRNAKGEISIQCYGDVGISDEKIRFVKVKFYIDLDDVSHFIESVSQYVILEEPDKPVESVIITFYITSTALSKAKKAGITVITP